MHRLLGSVLPALLLATVLAACGDETAEDPAGSEPTVTTSSPGGTGGVDEPEGSEGPGAVDFDLVDAITVTAAGGEISEVAVPLPDEGSVDEFVSQFESGDMAQQVRDAVAGADVPEGQAVYAAVVAIGCDAPTDIAVTDSDAGLVIGALKVPSPLPECFAPMTTVAVVVAAA